jgi:chorismate dehydratase
MKIRISLVHYLNSAPLGWAFLHGPFKGMFDIIPSSPANCADQLSSGEVDIGLIPSIEYQRIPGLQIIPNISISALDAVRSILLVKQKGRTTIDTVALDTSSRTSVALTKIFLHANMRLYPKFVPHPPNVAVMLKDCDAALLIGDPALKVRLEDYDVVDLAREWVQWQRKPFVFAFWACRSGAQMPADLNALFLEAKDWGLARREEIAASYSRILDLPQSFLEDYLVRNINFNLGPEHLEGLVRYYEMARQEQLVSELQPLRFSPGTTRL